VAVLKIAALLLHCVATTRDTTSLDYKSRILGIHKIHLTTYQTGDVINIFASVKIWPWPPRPWDDKIDSDQVTSSPIYCSLTSSINNLSVKLITLLLLQNILVFTLWKPVNINGVIKA